jgi:2-polyprenyl-3-methyl-5-hydroxy-6-metoxy-1,4-benzoquinol methylase
MSQVRGSIQTVELSIKDDADTKAQEFSQKHRLNAVHERQIAERMRKRQVRVAWLAVIGCGPHGSLTQSRFVYVASRSCTWHAR